MAQMVQLVLPQLVVDTNVVAGNVWVGRFDHRALTLDQHRGIGNLLEVEQLKSDFFGLGGGAYLQVERTLLLGIARAGGAPVCAMLRVVDLGVSFSLDNRIGLVSDLEVILVDWDRRMVQFFVRRMVHFFVRLAINDYGFCLGVGKDCLFLSVRKEKS